jgi:hypothetical protein
MTPMKAPKVPKSRKKHRPPSREKPISLAPLKFEEAVKGLLKAPRGAVRDKPEDE